MTKQLQVPGTEAPSVPEVDAAAEAYVAARDRRTKATEKEVVAKEALIAVLKKHSLIVYRDASATPPLVVTLVPGKENVKVSEADDMGGEDGEDE